jgi:hypothetical protein
MWCLSIWELMREPNRINPDHLDQIIERYFRFMFALGWQTSEVLYNVGQSVPSLNAWRGIFLAELEDCLKNPKQEHFTVLHRVFKALDWGKPFISDGYDCCRPNSTPTFFHDHEPTALGAGQFNRRTKFSPAPSRFRVVHFDSISSLPHSWLVVLDQPLTSPLKPKPGLSGPRVVYYCPNNP